MKKIKLFEAFQAKVDRSSTTFTLEEFKDFFNKQYSYITHDLTDADIQKFIDENKLKGEKLYVVADLFQDYLVSQGLADVQESTNEEYKGDKLAFNIDVDKNQKGQSLGSSLLIDVEKDSFGNKYISFYSQGKGAGFNTPEKIDAIIAAINSLRKELE